MSEEQRLECYDRCNECTKANTGHYWCKSCNATRFKKDFSTWTSGNKEIDYFIQNTQIHAWREYLVLEWYPWKIFSEIEKIGQGGYASVFRAKTNMTRIDYWDHQNNQWGREDKDGYVALKTIGHSESLLKEFLNEVNLYLY